MQLLLPNAHAPVWTSVPQAQSRSLRHAFVHAAPSSLRGLGVLVSGAAPPLCSEGVALPSLPAGESPVFRCAGALAGSDVGKVIGPEAGPLLAPGGGRLAEAAEPDDPDEQPVTAR
jgi:hypothetical protein